MLESHPKHAYELMQELGEKQGGAANSLFPHLQELLDEGLVHVDTAFGWRTYWLSAAGRSELENKVELPGEICATTVSANDRPARRGSTRLNVIRAAAEVTNTALRSAAALSQNATKTCKLLEILERAKLEIEVLAQQR